MHCIFTPQQIMDFWQGVAAANARFVQENSIGAFWNQFNKVKPEDWFDNEKIAEFWKEALCKPETFWFTENEVIYENDAYAIRLFKKGTSGKAILVVPPQAGHDSTIADFDDGQSLIQSAVISCNHTVCSLDFKSCTAERTNESLDDLVSQLKSAIDFVAAGELHKKVFLVGLCQGGWLAAITTYLYPEKIEKLVMAGSPIDLGVDRDKSAPCKIVETYPQKFYEGLVRVGGGMMRGEFMLSGWKSGNFIDRYFTDFVKMFQLANTDGMAKTHKFRGWYETVMNLAGNWYLQVVNDMFRHNMLWKQEMKVHDRTIRLQKLIKMFGKENVISIGSDGDDITPLKQAVALGGKTFELTGVGHIGLFMSSKVQAMWQNIFKSF